MAYTSNAQTGTTIQKEIKELDFSTVTGGASENITFPAQSMIAPVFNQEAITTANAHSEVGQQIGFNRTIDFTVIGTGAVADWTALNELKSEANLCAYVKITFIGGQTDVWDSGSTGSAIVYPNVSFSNDSDGTLIATVHCERIISNITKSVS